MINLMAPINSLGYGVASLNILKALQEKTDVALHMIGQPQVVTEQDANAVRTALMTAERFDPKAPCIKIWHQNQMAERVGSGKFIGFPIFELDTFTELEKHHLDSCDELMVCSEWAKEVVHNNLIKYDKNHFRTHVIPLGVDTEIFKPAPVRKEKKTIFFNCGKWEVRKGHDIIMEAFMSLLHHGEDAELWMMCSNPFNSPDENTRWHRLYDHPKVKIIPRAETQAQVYNIMSQVDCGVFPSRAEGWNLELLEMMAVGKHVIATDYAAHTEFCNVDNCSLIKISQVEPAYDGKWFFEQGNWAKIKRHEKFDLKLAMMNFILNKKGTLNEAGIETAAKFSWENSAKRILNSLG